MIKSIKIKYCILFYKVLLIQHMPNYFLYYILMSGILSNALRLIPRMGNKIITQGLSNIPDVKASSRLLSERFWRIDQQTMRTMDKILDLYREERIDAASFHGVDGYGYGDIGREKLDVILAKLLGAEAAVVRLQFFSGTHAIASALFGALRPGDNILCCTGQPYDTLEEVIGLRNGHQTGSKVGSLLDWGIGYQQINLLEDSDAKIENGEQVAFDLSTIDKCLEKDPKIKLLHVQRSCGYQWRPSIPVLEIGRLCEHINKKYKSKGRDILVFVDNCYGELVEEIEPCHVGADICAGSLIKNLGGTLAPSGNIHLKKNADERNLLPLIDS